MNKQTKIEKPKQVNEKPEGLALLREPFPENQIGKLPKPTKTQTADVKKDFKNGIRCEVCGGWHHPKVIHLDYVGHAALTDRLLNVDMAWYWEPLATYENGLPAFDEIGGLWIRLHILGQNRIGYGSADGKTDGNAKKEVIGDALRNAALRFGAALDLWHKGDLHIDNDPQDDPQKEPTPPDHEPSNANEPLPKTSLTKSALKAAIHDLCNQINTMKPADGLSHLTSVWQDHADLLRQARDDDAGLFKSAEESKDAAKVRFERDEQEFPI